MGEAFLDNAESDNALKISIPISELFCSPTQIVDAISSDMKDIDKLCITPVFLSESEKDDEYYERIRFEKFFCENYDKLADYKDKVYLQVRTASGMKKNKLIWEYEYVSLERLKEISDKIEMFTDDIKKSSLSPFEKTMALYFISTHFIESTDDLGGPISSSAMHILSEDKDNYKIVCAGYTDLFSRMAHECGIHTKEMGIELVDVNNNRFGGHSAVVVDLDDEKYGLHGSFICDIRAESDNMFSRRKKESNMRSDDSLDFFCLTYSDFNTYIHALYSSKYPEYSINNNKIIREEKTYLSDDRIDIMTISDAFKKVDEFRYGCESDKITDGRNLTLAFLLTIRGRLDELKELYGQCLVFEMYNHLKSKSSFDTSDELSQKMVSELMRFSKKETGTTKSTDSNSNNRK